MCVCANSSHTHCSKNMMMILVYRYVTLYTHVHSFHLFHFQTTNYNNEYKSTTLTYAYTGLYNRNNHNNTY